MLQFVHELRAVAASMDLYDPADLYLLMPVDDKIFHRGATDNEAQLAVFDLRLTRRSAELFARLAVRSL